MYTKRLYFLFLFILFAAVGFRAVAQDPLTGGDTIPFVPDPSRPADTILVPYINIDSIPQYKIDSMLGRPSVSPDTLHDAGESQAIDSPIEYLASDSVIYSLADQKVYLFKDGQITYRAIILNAGYIEFNMGNEAVFATGLFDSLGTEEGRPEFSEGSENFEAKKISYNFRNKKGIISDIFTEQEGGYLHSAITKRHPNDHIHMKNGKYTTCDAENPHFYIALTKAKSIPNDKIISGPAYIVLADVPLPLFIPFGFFPSNQVNQSGFLLPTYGEEERRGFYLRNGGFYFALSQYFDMTVTGDVYTNGTWGLHTRSNYKKNYKFSGNFGINYYENVSGDKGLENYSKSKDFAVRWTHGQDSRANPNQSIRASVDFSTTSFDENHNRVLQNALRSTKRSSVSYSRVFPNSPFNLSASMEATQNSQTRTIDMNLPTMNFNMNRIYPLKRKNAAGSPRFYEKLTVSYSSTLVNRLSAKEDSLLQKTKFSDFNNGYQHSIPVSLPVNFLNYFTVSPNVRYNGVIFTKAINPFYLSGADNPSGSGQDTLIVDTTQAFNYAHAIVPSIGLSLTPKIYGMYRFRDKSNIEAIRHVISPSASLSFTPDMTGIVPDYYQEVVVDSNGETRIYPKYDESVYNTPVPSGRQGSVSLSLKNNVEMKLKSRSDTTIETTKIKILDNLNFSSSYSMFKDSLKWSPIRMTGNTALFDRKVSFRFGGTFNPYSYHVDENGRAHIIDKAYFTTDRKLFRITNIDFSVGMNFRSNQGKKDEDNNQMEFANDPTARLIDPTGMDQVMYGSYVDFDIPWTFGIDYNFRYTKPYDEYDIIQSFRIRGDFSLTPKWKIGINSGFDFERKEVTTTNITIHRELHCWEMNVSVVPFGKYRSYSFQINIKSAILHDLQYDKGDSWYDNF